jgi:hypothetical protein
MAITVWTVVPSLEYGDEEDVAWMRRSFREEQIVEVLRTDPHLTPLSATFWALHFGVPTGTVAALQDTRRGPSGDRTPALDG